MTITEEIRSELFGLRDEKYGEFQKKLIPNIPPETVIGVRTPELRAMAKELAKREGIGAFLDELPHGYFEENQLHAFIISLEKDFNRALSMTEDFLPYIDNWATCDQMSPKVFRKHRAELLPHIKEWIAADRPYTVRFGIGMLMEHYLDGDFSPECPEMVAEVRSQEYYVNMMIAWYFATALAKQYGTAVGYIEGKRLDKWTHNKAIQKAAESYRVTPERKAYLKSLKIR